MFVELQYQSPVWICRLYSEHVWSLDSFESKVKDGIVYYTSHFNLQLQTKISHRENKSIVQNTFYSVELFRSNFLDILSPSYIWDGGYRNWTTNVIQQKFGSNPFKYLCYCHYLPEATFRRMVQGVWGIEKVFLMKMFSSLKTKLF